MDRHLPICCGSSAFRLFSSRLETVETSESLLQMACAIAMTQHPKVDPDAAERSIEKLADTTRQRVRGTQAQACLAHLHELLFEEEQFTGNTLDYYNAENSYLPSVLETKLGLPITLSLLYKLVAERVGFKSWGVPVPGHFMAAVEVDEKPLLVDAFASGRIMTVQEIRDRSVEVFGVEMEWSDDLLTPASHRHWLTRILQNLLNTFGSAGRYKEVAAMLELEMLLWPHQPRLQRDLGLVLARLGMSRPASAWLGRYLESNPDDPQSEDLKQLLDVLTT